MNEHLFVTTHHLKPTTEEDIPMLIQRLSFAFISLGVCWIAIMAVGALFVIFAPTSALRRILALTDNWLFRPLYNFVGWIVEARCQRERDG